MCVSVYIYVYILIYWNLCIVSVCFVANWWMLIYMNTHVFLYDSLTNLLLVSVWRLFPLKWITFHASLINHLNDVQNLKLLWTNKMKEEKREQKSIKKKKLLPEISFATNWRETTNDIFINLDLDAHSSSANLFTSPR